MVELERRCSYLLLASTVAPVVASGPRRSGVHGPRRAVAWDGGGWSGARTRDLAASARTVSGRGYLCAAATLGIGAAAHRRLDAGRSDRLGSFGGADHARCRRSPGRVVGRRAAGRASALGGPAATPARAVRGGAALRLVRPAGGRPPLPPLQPGQARHEPAPPPQRGVRGAGARAGAGGVVRVRRLRPPLTPADAAGRVDAPPGGARAADRASGPGHGSGADHLGEPAPAGRSRRRGGSGRSRGAAGGCSVDGLRAGRRRRPVRTAGTSRCAWTRRPACRWIRPTG